MKQKIDKIKRRGPRSYRKKNKNRGDGAAKYIIIILAVCIAIAGLILLLGRMDSVRNLFSRPSGEGTPAVTEPSGEGTQPSTEEPTTEPRSAEAVINLMGDAYVNSGLVLTSKTGDNTYDFSPILSPVAGSLQNGFSICNFETAVDLYGGNSQLSYYPKYNAPLELPQALKNAGVDLVNTANNHAFDFGLQGLLATREKLRAAGLDTVGTYADAADAAGYYIKEENGVKIGVVSYSYLDGVPEGDGTMKTFDRMSLSDVPAILKDAAGCRAAGADIVILSLHWGREYEEAPSDLQRQMAKQLCEGGVDVIMGHGSHVLQEAEKLSVDRSGTPADAYVFYSLGDFMVDLTSVNRPLTQYGGIARLTVEKADGKTVVREAGLVPLHIAKIAEGSTVVYRVLPAMEYAGAAARPEVYKRDSEWQACKAAYERAKGVMPADIPLLAK